MIKRERGLNKLVYAIPIAALTSFLPMKEAKSQSISELSNLNTISLTFQSGDLGLGIRYDRRFVNNLYPFGVYSCISKGLESEDYIKDHLKMGLGAVYYIKGSYFRDVKAFFGVGAAYHKYWDKKNQYEQLEEKELYKPLSADFTVGARIGRFSTFADIDPLKRHGSIGAGISFGGAPKKRWRCK
jgi:hypothetical protein